MKLHDRADWHGQSPEDQGRENCPLCNESEEYTIKKFKYWRVCHNKYPILEMEEHLMAIPLRHVILTSNLNDKELKEFSQVEKFMEEFYLKKGKEYFSFVRQSPLSRSLEHLHYHYLPGKIYYKNIEEMLKKEGL